MGSISDLQNKKSVNFAMTMNWGKKYDLIKEWYNGYIFGNTKVYNPWSVIQYVKALTTHEEEFPRSYFSQYILEYRSAQAD